MGLLKKTGHKSAERLLREFAEETTMFLDGDYAEFLGAAGRPVPPWALVNTVAHASAEHLVDLASMSSGRSMNHSDDWEWRACLILMAREVVGHAMEESRDIADLQRSVMVPLELEINGRADLADISLGQLLLTVQAVLDRDESDHFS